MTPYAHVLTQEDHDSNKKKLRDTEIKLEDQLQYSRRNCLLVHGIEEETKEKTSDKVVKIFNKILKLSRNTRSNKKKSRPIIVKFISYSDRKDVFPIKENSKVKALVLPKQWKQWNFN